MSDRPCQYCRAEIRWCRDEAERWIPLDIAKIPSTSPRAEFVVVGSEDARYIAKTNRSRHETLYQRHTCEEGVRARAIAKRERGASAARAQIAALPGKTLHVWKKV